MKRLFSDAVLNSVAFVVAWGACVVAFARAIG